MGGVYTLGPSEGTEVNNNVIHHIYSYTYGGWGLYTDEGSTGVLMMNNLVYACKSSGFHQHYGKDNFITNNIFANQLKAQLEATRIEPHNGFTFTRNIVYFNGGDLTGINWDKANFRSDSNMYWRAGNKEIVLGKTSFNEWQKAGKDVHSIIRDPMFVDAPNFDFRLQNKSLLSNTKFIPFDYSLAGVYGDKAWKHLAVFDPSRAEAFDKVVAKLEQQHSAGN
jgi:hypothetical protein